METLFEMKVVNIHYLLWQIEVKIKIHITM